MRLTRPLETALKCWIQALLSAPPRTIAFVPELPPVVIFTDGCCDPETGWAGIGAVCFDRFTGTREAFGVAIPEEFMAVMRAECGYKQLIAQAEILPVLAAKIRWKSLLTMSRHRRVIFFLDNDAARYGLIKGYSPTRTSAWLLSEAWRLDEGSGVTAWFDRVPTKSNCADGPSRLDFSRLWALGDGGTSVVSPPPFWDELFRRRVSVGA